MTGNQISHDILGVKKKALWDFSQKLESYIDKGNKS